MRKLAIVTALAITLSLGVTAPVAGALADSAQTVTADTATAAAPRSIPGQYLVTFADSVSDTKAQDVVEAAATEATDNTVDDIREVADSSALVTLDGALSSTEQTKFEHTLSARSQVEQVEPNYVFSRSDYALSNDSYASSLWNIETKQVTRTGLSANAAWAKGVTGSGQVIAIVDTGIIAHPDLKSKTLAGHDFVSQVKSNSKNQGYGLSNDGNGWDSDATDPGDYCTAAGVTGEDAYSSWHGSHLAGIAAATRDNSTGVAGVAPSAKILPVRVLGSCGSGTLADIVAGITWASGGTVKGVTKNANPADVINLSLGLDNVFCRKNAPSLQAAITAAIKRGTTVVAAAGNSSAPLATSAPANCKGVIDVTASTRNGKIAFYSNLGGYGSNLVVAAPGGGGSGYLDTSNPIMSTVNSSTKKLNTAASAYIVSGMIGTSMAAPHVSGMVALIKQLHPSYTPAQVGAALKKSAMAWSASSKCTRTLCGAGIVSAAKLVGAKVPNLSFSKAAKPSISGKVRVGATLTANPGSWSPTPTYSYSWIVAGTKVASTKKYKIPAKYVGKTIQVRVSGTKSEYTTVAKTSGIKTIAKGVIKTRKVKLSGKARVGRTLKATTSSWGSGVKLSYKWYANGKLITGNTSAKLKLTKKYKGKRIRVVVYGAKTGYVDAHRGSAAKKVKK